MLVAQLNREVQLASTPTPPKPRKLKTGREIWRSRWYDDQGERHDKSFGYTDEVSPREAKLRYRSWLSEWELQDRVKNPTATQHTYTAKQLAQDYLNWARGTFVKNGRMTSFVWQVAYAMQSLADAFGERPISTVDNPSLAKLRDGMIFAVDADGKQQPRSITTVNGRLDIIKSAYKWARERGLVTAEALADVLAVQRLRRGRSQAKDPKEVKPVDEHWVAVAKEHASSVVAAMIDLQWLTGMRPGEVCIMRPCDIDTTGQVWLYKPMEHKTEHLDGFRVIPLGPKAQAVLKPFLEQTPDVEAHLFSPADAAAERREKRRLARQTKLKYGNSAGTNRVERPRRRPGDCYSEQAYRRAIHYACSAADRAAKAAMKKAGQEFDPAVRMVPKWNPNQLRHAAATRLNKTFGIESVAVTLGHSDISTTRIYAEPDVSKAVEIAKQVG